MASSTVVEARNPMKRSTLHASCGCGWYVRADNDHSPYEVLDEAEIHADSGHTVNITGVVRP